RLLQGLRRVAMEYSPRCAIPYVSRVDAGTIELVRAAGVEVVSSGDLIQRFASVWNERAIATHEEASEKLHRVKDRAFEAIARRTAARNCGDGRSIGPRPWCCEAPDSAIASCTGRATASESRCTVMALIWTTTRRMTIGDCSSALALLSSRVFTSTTSACDRK